MHLAGIFRVLLEQLLRLQCTRTALRISFKENIPLMLLSTNSGLNNYALPVWLRLGVDSVIRLERRRHGEDFLVLISISTLRRSTRVFTRYVQFL
jgi:hypothetical protein